MKRLCVLTLVELTLPCISCSLGPKKQSSFQNSGGAWCARPTEAVLLALVGILDQSAVWVDEMNYYDMRTDRNKGIPPLSLRPANPLGIEIEK